MEGQKQQYLSYITQALHIEFSDFMQCVAEPDRCYEPLIYKWVITLFNKGVPKQRALHIIQRARMRILLQNNAYIQSQIKSQKIESIEQMLKHNAYYNKLTDEEKAIAIQKIASITNHKDVSMEIISKVLESMNPIIEVRTTENKMMLFKNTLNRIKKEIHKILKNQ